MGVCTKERKGGTAEVLMATPCTNSLGGESGEQKHEGCGGRSACWKYAAVSGSGAGLLSFGYFLHELPLEFILANGIFPMPRTLGELALLGGSCRAISRSFFSS